MGPEAIVIAKVERRSESTRPLFRKSFKKIFGLSTFAAAEEFHPPELDNAASCCTYPL
jgi:hypothetical protein